MEQARTFDQGLRLNTKGILPWQREINNAAPRYTGRWLRRPRTKD